MQLSSLVLAEQKHGKLQPATLHAVTAAKQLGGPVTVLVAGKGIAEVASAASAIEGVEKVLVADDASLEHVLAEPAAALLAQVQSKRNFSHLIAPSTTFGRNILPRAAALLNIQPVADVIEIQNVDTYVRPIYAGNALATVKALGDNKTRCLTVRPTAFSPAAVSPHGNSSAAPTESVDSEELDAAKAESDHSEWVSETAAVSERPELSQAKVVVSGGRALKNQENFAAIERLADLLGGAVGASRAAVDAGYAPNDLQVGQTGKVVAPELYIAIGISGAIQHVAGMKDSKVIVAINSDGEAPIFQVSDYGLVGDLFKILPELEEELKKVKN
jgi:electron transfer flavoprotein alpha subunit